MTSWRLESRRRRAPGLAIRSLPCGCSPRSRRGRALRTTGADMELLFVRTPRQRGLPASSMRRSRMPLVEINRVGSTGHRRQGRRGHAGFRSQGAHRTVRSVDIPFVVTAPILVACHRGTVLSLMMRSSDPESGPWVRSPARPPRVNPFIRYLAPATPAWAHPVDLDARVGDPSSFARG